MSQPRFSNHTREIRAFAVNLGYEITHTSKGHIRFIHPQGEKIIITSSTPSDGRAYKNCMKDLERNLKPKS